MINYIIQIVFFQVIFLAVYDLFLRKETFFKWNRVYLLMTPILSFIIPLLKFESFKSGVSEEYIVLLPEVVFNPQIVIEQTFNTQEVSNYSFPIFYVGFAIFSIVFLIKLFKIIQLLNRSKILKRTNYKLIIVDGKNSAFSFFNYIFVGKSQFENKELQIIKHELVHSKQYHTLDLLFFELLKIITWFNPLIYIYQNRITLLHEYISDAEVVKETDKNSYFNKLLKETFEIENISFVNQFYKQSLIKKRIMMIAKEKSQSVKQFKYLLLIPVLASMLFYVSCTDNIQESKNPIEEINIYKNEIEESISFLIIDQVPTFPGCSGDTEILKECLNKGIRQHINKNFNIKVVQNERASGKQKIFVKFKITKFGTIEIEKIKAPNSKLEKEARRVVNSLPKMTPGKHGGKQVNVTYMLPIVFEIQ
jgi:hypothetical protein